MNSKISNFKSTHEDTMKSKITWPQNQQLPTFASPEHLDVVDMVDEPGEIKLMLATLQGNVNRHHPRIYLLENIEEGKYTWLKDLNIPYTEHEEYGDIVMKYKEEITGM